MVIVLASPLLHLLVRQGLPHPHQPAYLVKLLVRQSPKCLYPYLLSQQCPLLSVQRRNRQQRRKQCSGFAPELLWPVLFSPHLFSVSPCRCQFFEELVCGCPLG